MTLDQAREEFLKKRIDAYFQEHITNKKLHPGMRLIFEFYLNPKTQTQLWKRM